MDRLRIVPAELYSPQEPCCRCQVRERRWDRIAGKPICPACEEALAVGEGPPLIERTEPRRCASCDHGGTIRFTTYPLNSECPIEIDLCPEHLRRMVGRHLGPHAFFQLRRQLQALDIPIDEIFLLHDTFYDSTGRALLPAVLAD